jgi:predicted dithiol-disulfide oxidoreductase (DUF899 family)
MIAGTHAPERGTKEEEAMIGTDAATYTREAPGMSAFALENGLAYHTYSAYARGVDALWGGVPVARSGTKGRNETGPWFRRRWHVQTGSIVCSSR